MLDGLELSQCKIDQMLNNCTALRLIARNIEQTRAKREYPSTFELRHIMVITNNPRAIPQILFDKKILKPQRTNLFDRDETCIDHLYGTISKIMTAMRRGKTCVLLQSHFRQLFHSLYDVLNQKYTIINNERYCQIHIGGKSIDCKVHPSFKIIAIASTKEISNVPPAFLDRFERVYLDTDTVTSSNSSRERGIMLPSSFSNATLNQFWAKIYPGWRSQCDIEFDAALIHRLNSPFRILNMLELEKYQLQLRSCDWKIVGPLFLKALQVIDRGHSINKRSIITNEPSMIVTIPCQTESRDGYTIECKDESLSISDTKDKLIPVPSTKQLSMTPEIAIKATAPDLTDIKHLQGLSMMHSLFILMTFMFYLLSIHRKYHYVFPTQAIQWKYIVLKFKWQ